MDLLNDGDTARFDCSCFERFRKSESSKQAAGVRLFGLLPYDDGNRFLCRCEQWRK